MHLIPGKRALEKFSQTRAQWFSHGPVARVSLRIKKDTILIRFDKRSATTMNQNEIDQQVQLLRTKRLIQDLESAQGHGTSMISLYIPPGQLVRVSRMLRNEYAVAANIKSRV